ncbi:unnamed protein product [Parnassius apollo]|uniref:(apollo) hypothetical protein n=1 Tax=Parnassius apollo TaxID=110799 RepID=A0A8S3Y4P2_PARAO|nr:unnamed protein product [Parnassius apollo]
MSVMKKSAKSKFMSDDLNDFINESQFLKDSPKNKKVQKRLRPETTEESTSNTVNINNIGLKKKKTEDSFEVCRESRQKLLNVMNHQIEARKKTNENLLKSLSEIVTHLEADYNALKDNEQKLEHLTGAFIKCIQQTTNAHKQKLKALKEVHSTFKKECEEMETDHRMETDKLGEELEQDIRKLQQKLVSETKRSGWETLRRTIFQAMQNDF